MEAFSEEFYKTLFFHKPGKIEHSKNITFLEKMILIYPTSIYLFFKTLNANMLMNMVLPVVS